MYNRPRHHYGFDNRQPPPYFQQQQPPHPHTNPNFPHTHITPYELYAKPPQPLNMLSGTQDPYAQNQQHQQQAPAGILGAITDQNGQVDFDKAMTTINQLASTYHQVSPIVRQISSLLKMFR